jgi:hypothetical protein
MFHQPMSSPQRIKMFGFFCCAIFGFLKVTKGRRVPGKWFADLSQRVT